MPRSPQWMDLYQIWFRGSPRGRNQMCGILLQSAHGFRFCEGSKFAISHWLGWSPLTQCWRYRAACDDVLIWSKLCGIHRFIQKFEIFCQSLFENVMLETLRCSCVISLQDAKVMALFNNAILSVSKITTSPSRPEGVILSKIHDFWSIYSCFWKHDLGDAALYFRHIFYRMIIWYSDVG